MSLGSTGFGKRWEDRTGGFPGVNMVWVVSSGKKKSLISQINWD